MTWTAEQRDFFFGDLDRFVQVYCSAYLKGLMGIPGDGALTCEARPRFDSLRRVGRRLSELMPTAGHTSPCYNGHPLPILVMGRMSKAGRVIPVRSGESCAGRVGVARLGDDLHLFVDIRLRAPAEFGPRLENIRDWTHWRGEGGKASYIYRTPIDLPDEFVPENHPLHESHPVARLLAWVGDLHPGQHPHSILEKLESHRNAAGPRDHSVIYPRLLESWRRPELQ